ncbi:(d)CMP kinase, partial [Francisella tularensis subsp. holarctica]
IKQRDCQDRNGKVAPLRPANVAIIVDTSQLSIKDVFDSVIKKITI